MKLNFYRNKITRKINKQRRVELSSSHNSQPRDAKNEQQQIRKQKIPRQVSI